MDQDGKNGGKRQFRVSWLGQFRGRLRNIARVRAGTGEPREAFVWEGLMTRKERLLRLCLGRMDPFEDVAEEILLVLIPGVLYER